MSEVCARCGHRSKGCPSCGKQDPFLGASIGDDDYCHTFVETQPSCYTLAYWDGAYYGKNTSSIEILGG